MKENNKSLKMVLTILIIVLISLISFLGVYVKEKNRMKNVIPEYKTGMDFNGKFVFSLKPDDTVNKEYYDKDGNKVDSSSIEEGKEEEYETREIAVNSKDNLTKENFDKTKSILEKRLELLGVKEYEIRENESNGEFYISIPEDKNKNKIISELTMIGDFKVTDSKDEENVLIEGNKVKDVKVGLVQQQGGQAVAISIEFDKDGSKQLREISKIYTGETVATKVQKEDSNSEEENNKNELEEKNAENIKKEVNLVLDDENLTTTSFPEEVKDGTISLTMSNSGSSTSQSNIQKSLEQASNLAALLKTGKLPIKYNVDTSKYIQSDFEGEDINKFIILVVGIIIIMVIYLIFKYKKQGILLAISQIGFLAVLLVIVRYANVSLSLTGIFAIILSFIMSYIFILGILKEEQKNEKSFSKITVNYLTIYAPCLIISVVFSFMNNLSISSFGMVMFYGIMLMVLYHGIATRNLIIKSENK